MTINGETKILKCTCKSAYQDKRYGKDKRVHNVGGATGSRTYRCTVCATSRTGK